MSSRTDIIDRIRARLGRDPENAATARAAMAAHLQARPRGPRPELAGDLVAHFRERSQRQSSTVGEAETLAAVPAAVGRYLADHGLPQRAVCWPQFADLAWEQAGIAAEARAALGSDLVGITGCFCALAETGTLMLLSGRETPATVSLLPETHIAIVPAGRVVAGMEEAWALAKRELGELPRAANFISGPSRTGDIEQTIVLGAHGPYRVHIIIVRER